MDKPKLALILGSGFSCAAGLPTTVGLSKVFLRNPHRGASGIPASIENCISEILGKFWVDVFGYDHNQPESQPTMEDHFTILESALQNESDLGRNYPISYLKTIHNLSLHRVFTILNSKLTSQKLQIAINFFEKLEQHFQLSILTTNWDIVVEHALHQNGKNISYVVDIHDIEATANSFVNQNSEIQLMKLHGSSNWLYCTKCKILFVDGRHPQKSTLTKAAFLDKSQLRLLCANFDEEGIQFINELAQKKQKCSTCGKTLNCSVATFSFRKPVSRRPLKDVWKLAKQELAQAERWLFIGYSIPLADFEFGYLIKNAQMHRRHESKILAITKGSPDTENRFKGFFGNDNVEIWSCGLDIWKEARLDVFCQEHGA